MELTEEALDLPNYFARATSEYNFETMADNEATSSTNNAIHIVTETRNPRSPPIVAPEDPSETGKCWEDWLEAIEREFCYFKITDPIDKTDALLIYGGKTIASLTKSLPDPTEGNDYAKLRNKLKNHYLPKKNKHHSPYLFLQMRPRSEESINSYAARLIEKAQDCEFGTTHDERILEHIIQTIDNKTLIQKAINKEWNLTQFLREAGQMEDIKRQVTGMKPDQAAGAHSINRVEPPAYTQRFQPRRQSMGNRRPRNSTDWKPRRNRQQSHSDYCGYDHARGTNVHRWNRHATTATRKITFRLFGERRLARAPRLT